MTDTEQAAYDAANKEIERLKDEIEQLKDEMWEYWYILAIDLFLPYAMKISII